MKLPFESDLDSFAPFKSNLETTKNFAPLESNLNTTKNASATHHPCSEAWREEMKKVQGHPTQQNVRVISQKGNAQLDKHSYTARQKFVLTQT